MKHFDPDPHLFQVVDVHELGSDGAAIDLFQALDDIAQGQSFLLKVFRDKGLVLKEKREKNRVSRGLLRVAVWWSMYVCERVELE